MKIELKKYDEQIVDWPKSGYHIMAQYDDEEMIVYQSYRKDIGEFAAKISFLEENLALPE